MRTAAVIIGLFGAGLGLFALVGVGLLGVLSGFFQLPAILTLLWVFIGFAASADLMKNPRFDGVALIVAAVGGLVTATALWLPSFVLLLIAGILAIVSSSTTESRIA